MLYMDPHKGQHVDIYIIMTKNREEIHIHHVHAN